MNFYSYSKVNCFKNCPLQYNLQYIQKIKLPRVYSYDTAKGLIFHSYAEHYNGDRRQALEKAFAPDDQMPQEYIDRLTQKEKQTISEKCYLYEDLWENSFKGCKVRHEMKLFVEEKYAFTGYMDALLEIPDEENGESDFVIVDFKTAKTANASTYAPQLRTYAHFLSKQEKIPLKRIKAAVFFPFAEGESYVDRWKNVDITQKNVDNTITEFEDVIKLIEADASNKEANLGFLCRWCSFAGDPKYCETSVIAGVKKN
jgi:hypothetical protein